MFSCTSRSACTFNTCGEFGDTEPQQEPDAKRAHAFGTPAPESFPSSSSDVSAPDELSPFQAQLITDNVYLGPLGIAQNPTEMDKLGIGVVVSILLEKPEDVESGGRKLHHFKVADTVEAEATMLLILPIIVALIGDYAKKGEGVFVHCSSGISRSAAVVVAYVMWALDMALMDAYTHVRKQRSCINPNDGFYRALQSYEMDMQHGLGRSVTEEQQTENLHKYHAHQLASTLSFVGVTVEKATAVLERCGQNVEEAAAALMRDAEEEEPGAEIAARSLPDSPMGGSFLGADPPTPDGSPQQ